MIVEYSLAGSIDVNLRGSTLQVGPTYGHKTLTALLAADELKNC